MEDINNDIHEQFQVFSIIVNWNVNYVKLCRLPSILNSPYILKNSDPSYKENFQNVRKIWIEFGQLILELKQDKKKIQAYKV
jgi:hypothetical protein